jgi:CRISPR system Cascade subunit CasB
MSDTQTSAPVAVENTDNGSGKSLSSIVGSLAFAIEKVFSTGTVAELRRLRPNDPASPAFWSVMAEYWEVPYSDDEAHRKACLLSSLARTKGLHNPKVTLGSALAEASYSEFRYVRLLRAQDNLLFKEIELMAEFLNSKAQQASWTQVAELLFTRDEEKAESLRRKISHDYYKTLKH